AVAARPALGQRGDLGLRLRTEDPLSPADRALAPAGAGVRRRGAARTGRRRGPGRPGQPAAHAGRSAASAHAPATGGARAAVLRGPAGGTGGRDRRPSRSLCWLSESMTMPPYEVVTVATSSGANARTGARVRLVVLRAVPTLQPTQLADQPVPLGMVDRALAGSVSLRRRHRILTAVSALGVIGLISASAAVGLPRLAANFVDPTVPPGSVPT